MTIFDYIDEKTLSFGLSFGGWRDAVLYAGGLLEEAGYITGQYTQDMVSLIESLGPYIVVMPGVALAHARPEGHVMKNSIAIVTLKDGLNFGHEMNDPVKVIFAIAAVNDDEHLKLFQSVADYLIDENNLNRVLHAKNINDLKGDSE